MTQAKVFHSGDVVSCQSEPSWQDFVSMGVARGNASVRTVPTFDLEAELMDQLHGPIVGIDAATERQRKLVVAEIPSTYAAAIGEG